MSSFAETIKRIRLLKGMTQEEFATLLGTSKQNISRYESGDVSPKISTAAAMAKKLGVTLSQLNGNDDLSSEDFPLPSNIVPIEKMPSHKIPMIGTVAAGVPIWEEDSYDLYIDGPSKADFAMRIEGDSMEPTYYNGDIVYIKSQSDVSDGQIAVVVMDNQATLKHVYHGKDTVTLISDNSKYAPMIMRPEDFEFFRVIGYPVGFTRMYNASNRR